MTTHPHEPVTFGQTPLRIEDVLALANAIQAPEQLKTTVGLNASRISRVFDMTCGQVGRVWPATFRLSRAPSLTPRRSASDLARAT